MQLSEIRIHLCGDATGRLRAYCALTFDHTFVVRDVKLIEKDDGLFLAMPSRKICDHCPRCGEKNHLRARYCNECGGQLSETRAHARGGPDRPKLHCDIAHPVNARSRVDIERRVLEAYDLERQRAEHPDYVATRVDADLPPLGFPSARGTRHAAPSGNGLIRAGD